MGEEKIRDIPSKLMISVKGKNINTNTIALVVSLTVIRSREEQISYNSFKYVEHL